MRRWLFVLAFLFLPAIAQAQEGWFVRGNCVTDLPTPSVGTICVQNATAGNYSAGNILKHNGVSWILWQPRRGGCSFVFGNQDAAGSVLTDAQLTGQGYQCLIPADATVVQITVNADAGTPNILLRRRRPNGGTTANLSSSALATNASGALNCTRATATTSLDGSMTCLGTLINASLSAGDWIETVSGTASTARRFSVAVTWLW